MTPQQIKARELVEKYASIIPNSGYYTDAEYIVNNDSIKIAKQCAIIAVDEIIDIINTLEKNSYFYQQVKEEINKL